MGKAENDEVSPGFGIIEQMRRIMEDFRKCCPRVVVEDRISICEGDVPVALWPVLLEVIEEAIENVSKHSQASVMLVFLGRTDGRIEFRVEDDGIGIGGKEIHLDRDCGVTRMQDMVESAGGVFGITVGKGRGTIVRVLDGLR